MTEGGVITGGAVMLGIGVGFLVARRVDRPAVFRVARLAVTFLPRLAARRAGALDLAAARRADLAGFRAFDLLAPFFFVPPLDFALRPLDPFALLAIRRPFSWSWAVYYRL
jgi:hypothetical protein